MQRCSVKRCSYRNFAKFTGRHLCQSACNVIKKEPPAQVFSCEFCGISKNTFFYRTPLVAASGIFIILGFIIHFTYVCAEAVALSCSVKKVFLEISQNLQENAGYV